MEDILDFPVIHVHKNKKGIYDLNVKTKGWASKDECKQLTKQEKLDLIICRSPQGHEYLRARLGSSVNMTCPGIFRPRSIRDNAPLQEGIV